MRPVLVRANGYDQATSATIFSCQCISSAVDSPAPCAGPPRTRLLADLQLNRGLLRRARGSQPDISFLFVGSRGFLIDGVHAIGPVAELARQFAPHQMLFRDIRPRLSWRNICTGDHQYLPDGHA